MAALTFTPASDPAPLSELNTTPLIDVLLVLLVMFIITIPLQSHKASLDLPSGKPPTVLDSVVNKVVVTETGRLLFNGAEVSSAQLQTLFDQAAQLPREPELQIHPAPDAPYGAVNEVIVLTRRADLTRLGFVGNDRYASF